MVRQLRSFRSSSLLFPDLLLCKVLSELPKIIFHSHTLLHTGGTSDIWRVDRDLRGGLCPDLHKTGALVIYFMLLALIEYLDA